MLQEDTSTIATSAWPAPTISDKLSARSPRSDAESIRLALPRDRDEQRRADGPPSSRPERKVLILASRFPPVASVGAVRVRKFAKYLGRYGWRPVVITGAMRKAVANSQDARRATDFDSLGDIPTDVAVHRLSPIVDHWPTHLTRFLATRLAGATRRLGWDSLRWSGFLNWRLQNVHDRFSFPDRGIWRLPAAVHLALDLHRRHRFDAVFTSGMPFSDHLIGLVLHELLRLPWLVDFRDPWVEYIHWQQWDSSWGRRLTHAAEAAVVRRASCVISVNNQMTDRFRSRYEASTIGKFVTIENGFDPADYPQEGFMRPGGEFRLLYAGSLYKTRSPLVMLEAFRQFVEQTPGAGQRARFDFAGRPGPFTTEFSKPADEGRVSYLGMLSHVEALRRMASADVNVILLPNLPGATGDSTAKVYECLGSGRAILAAVPFGGAAATALGGFDGVWLCDPEDPVQIARVLGDLYRRWLTGELQPDRPLSALEGMTRQHQSRQLAECLDAVTAARTRRE